jgi:peptidoglycan/LPS O-acetylase OafA/YrhL
VRRNHKRRIRSGHRKFLWIFGGAFTICALLYWEQTALLYVLSTLAMCGLMLVVAFSNLEAKDKEIHNRALEKLSTNSDEWTQTENKAA